MSDENDHVDENTQSTEIPQPAGEPQKFWGMNLNTYCMLMNLIQILPGWGWVIAILMWILNKDNSPEIDRYGKNAANWIISFAIYILCFGMINMAIGIVGFIITLISGAPLFLLGHIAAALTALLVMVIGLTFPIIAAVKANDGKYWPYPLCIRFFK